MRWILGLAGLLTAGLAAAEVLYDDAEVVGVTPVYESVRIAEPREVCHEERVRVDPPRRSRRYVSATPPIIGGIVGGVIGRAVGRDKGAGTVIGAVLGATLARDVAHSRQRHEPAYGGAQFRTEDVCEVRDAYREEERLVGYQVTYAYAGGRFTTFAEEHPGATLRVKVRVTPA
jgi:uncharacterized protein YcfJ